MREYIYVDGIRLKNYVDQIASPVKYDRVREFNLELSIIGPKATVSQKQQARDRTTHEEVSLVETHLRRSKLLETKRFRLRSHPPMAFYIESFEAFNGTIEKDGFKLKLWLSRQKYKNHERPYQATILIEDFRGYDRDQATISGYSGLSLLASELEWLKNTPLSDVHDDLAKQKYFEEELGHRPFSTLENLGFRFGPTQNITALYRFRASCIAQTARALEFLPTVIGYPICIWRDLDDI